MEVRLWGRCGRNASLVQCGPIDQQGICLTNEEPGKAGRWRWMREALSPSVKDSREGIGGGDLYDLSPS